MSPSIPFQSEAHSYLSRTDARMWAIEVLGRDLGYARYALVAQAPRQIDFSRQTRSLGVWVLTVLLFPLGLLFYFVGAQRSIVTVCLESVSDGRTLVTVSGQAPRRVVEGIQYRLETDFESDLDDDPSASDAGASALSA